MYFKLLFICLVTVSWPVNSKIVNTEKIKFEITIPDKLQLQEVKNFYGYPFLLLGPMSDQHRPTLGITSLNKKLFKELALKGPFDYEVYQKNKKEWIESHKGKLIKTEPLKKMIRSGFTVYAIGIEYKINNVTYFEDSYYFACRTYMFNAKTILIQGHEKYKEIFQRTIKSLKCVE